MQKRVPQGHAADGTRHKACQNRPNGLLRRRDRATSAEEKMSKFLDNPKVHRYDGTSPINSTSISGRPSTPSFLRNRCDDRAMR